MFLPLLAILIVGCAKQGAPTGGPKDEAPPVVLKTVPENYSTNFSSRKILITFDEYLDMANFTQELVVSPPMEEKPVVKLRNKTLIIEFEEELKGDVTYTFNFGEGIKDLNEKNVLLNYEYVFSTGDLLDSLSIKGTLKNAFDLLPPEPPIFVMLYLAQGDSLPLTDIPYYVGRTDKEGNFAVNNLREGTYKLFVLKDGNNNFLFDQPNEQIAFLDTSLTVDPEYYREILLSSGKYDSTDLYRPDTLILSVDTTGMSADSLKILLDSLEKTRPDFNSLFVDLFMFTEDQKNQYISAYSRDKRETMVLLFNLPLKDSFAFEPVFPLSLGSADLLADYGVTRDTLVIWTGDTTISSLDTIGLALKYTALDSLELPVTVFDTLTFAFREKKTKGKTTAKAGTEKKPLNVKTVSKAGKHHILKDLVFTIENPVGDIDPSLFELYVIPDTIEIPVEIYPTRDSTSLHKVRIKNAWDVEGKYRIVLYPGAITDLYGSTNDTLDRKFSIRPLSEYGVINLALDSVSGSVIIELYQGTNLVRKQQVENDGTYVFDYLDPATYRVKFIHDTNRNGKWDTGKYLEHRQPERVEFLPKDVKVRSNWDHDLKYSMGTNTSPPSAPEEEKKPLSVQ